MAVTTQRKRPAFVFFESEADSGYISGEVLTIRGGETTAG